MSENKVTVKICRDLHYEMKKAALDEKITLNRWIEEAIRYKIKNKS
jgi:predicted HicB family RNase H-like nuclease